MDTFKEILTFGADCFAAMLGFGAGVLCVVKLGYFMFGG
jgi:hypothetical protein